MTVPDTDIAATSLFFLEIHFKPGKSSLQVTSLQVVPESHGLKGNKQLSDGTGLCNT